MQRILIRRRAGRVSAIPQHRVSTILSNRLVTLLTTALISSLLSLSSATHAADWQDLPSRASYLGADMSGKTLAAQAERARYLLGDTRSLRAQLLNNDTLDLAIPLPNGEMAVYHLVYTPIAEQGLLDKFPDIRTFRGVDVDNPSNRGRFDISPAGFRGMLRHRGETIFIDPRYHLETEHYLAYYAKDAQPFETRPDDQLINSFAEHLHTAIGHASRLDDKAAQAVAKGASDNNLRTYRLAVAAAGEYTSFHGGTVSGALAAITTAINRVNEVYEHDLGISLQLVANNDQIIYIDAATDPYENDAFNDIATNQGVIDSVIGSANYDVGHLFNTGAGGLAGLAVVCGSAKAQGVTGLGFPVGDVFYVDFVAHELGHQFSANHTFNGTTLSCGGFHRNGTTAYEPGSGSTIMAYAGLCGDENLQNNSNAYFHAGSIAEITRFITDTSAGGRCGTVSAQLNIVPDVSAGDDVAIPAHTPFVLSGSATDADTGDTLIYTWEQMDTGSASSSQQTMVDDGSRTLFRSWAPSTSAERYFPRLSDVVANTTTLGEAYPTTSRDLNFRLTVRDGSGATAYDNKRVTVIGTAGPFALTAPQPSTLWSPGLQTVSWDVAGTASPPINCSEVDILLSNDNGASFTVSLIAGTANDGTEDVTAPAGVSGTVKVMVKCANNVFFAVNNKEGNSLLVDSHAGGGGGGSLGIMLTGLLLSIRVLRRRGLCQH
ncbi:MAG: hypothetical protein KTR20_11180 [Cellvibrionaceae bacterium]|nr:hypothetical protein [Cellvibrionaceae bacterium]